jgi:hypothetical protein
MIKRGLSIEIGRETCTCIQHIWDREKKREKKREREREREKKRERERERERVMACLHKCDLAPPL